MEPGGIGNKTYLRRERVVHFRNRKHQLLPIGSSASFRLLFRNEFQGRLNFLGDIFAASLDKRNQGRLFVYSVLRPHEVAVRWRAPRKVNAGLVCYERLNSCK